MRRWLGCAILLMCAVMMIFNGCQDSTESNGDLSGVVEDQWGNKIDLADYDDRAVVMNPFSPANCGWCFFDGDFIRENYNHKLEEAGGKYFGFCLFNSQKDIYGFQKHYREKAQVITSPIALHKKYHNDGFPWLTAFVDGDIVYSQGAAPYGKVYDSLAPLLWGDPAPPLTLTSPIHMATRFTSENQNDEAIYIIPDHDTLGYQRMLENEAFVRKQYEEKEWDYNQSYEVRFESDLTDDDLKKNLYIAGRFVDFNLKYLKNHDTPVKITDDKIVLGDYAFPQSEISFLTCFPNPNNPEKYVVLKLYGSHTSRIIYKNNIDYIVCENKLTDGSQKILLEGFYRKDKNNWTFDHSLAFADKAGKSFCTEGKCPAPIDFSKTRSQSRKDIEFPKPVSENGPNGQMVTLGNAACRFPEIVTDDKGNCWTTWEEKGDIVLASVNQALDCSPIIIESDNSDSYAPVLANSQGNIWVFYLNDIDGFYRLYGRYYDGQRLSEEILFSDKVPYDVITPAVAANHKGEMILAWSEWRANLKYLLYRKIDNRVAGEINTARIKFAPNDNYSCAWYPDVDIDDNGNIRAAWCQHYPITFCSVFGDLENEPVLVSDKFAGYPDLLTDSDGKHWVFWETSLWNYVQGYPQYILGAVYSEDEQKFSLPYTLSDDSMTVINQTPRAALDVNGNIRVVWSGRIDEESPWHIYTVTYDGGKWSSPQMISPESENARAPVIDIAENGDTWVAWHAGTGDKMKVKLLRLIPDKFVKENEI